MVQPDMATIPGLTELTYYLDGKKIKEKELTLGGSKGFDTTSLNNGLHTLTMVYSTPDGDKLLSVNFNVLNPVLPVVKTK